MNRLLIAVCCVCAALAAPAKKDAGEKQRTLDSLKSRLSSERDALESEIASRWEAKQRYAGQRESDKESLAQLRDRQERAYLELSRVKEECFARERLIEDEQRNLAQAQDGWRYVGATVEEMLAQEADKVLEAFVLDREQRRLAIENVRRAHQEDGNALRAFDALVGYKTAYTALGATLSVKKANVIPEEGGVEQLTIARFGHVFAYGMNSANEVFVLRQTGKLGPQRYTVERITEPTLASQLQDRFPSWVQEGRPSGEVPCDVLQNAQSHALTTGEKAAMGARARDYVRAGGPVMVPLLLLPLWALVLIVIKIVELSGKRRSGARVAAAVLDSLDKHDIAKAKQAAAGAKGLVGRVVATCLEHSEWSRDAAERAVREILAEESPRLGRYLNTLAVIAGVAPLLGLLGTVTGMINLFEVITNYGTGDSKIMAGGISEALITTQTGLTIAIPILLIHNYLRNKKSRIQAQMEKSAIAVLNRLWPAKGKEV